MISPSLSRPARWRIATLVFVHLCIAAHITHWLLAGRSLSSIQLSDAGRFATEGVATASVFFFACLLLVTLVFGRVFCAWACHMLALQEACRWLLGKLGIRPKLMPSRVLWLVPFGASFYLFILPFVERFAMGAPFPTPHLALTSEHLWANLPGPIEAVAAVLVGGAMMVYLLGSLSFCKYVCPYGAVFAVADNLALGRIRLTGACDECAQCTAACTTGVRVHEEVLRLGMVASSGCMRCGECVSACPQDALSYRVGRPALAAGRRAHLTHYAFSWPEEGILVGLFGSSFVALHGVYNAVPLLLALATSVVIAFLGVLAVRIVAVRGPVHLRGIALTRAGHWAPAGVLVVLCTLAALLVVGHSAFVQYHEWRADRALGRLGFPTARASYHAEEQALASRAAADLEWCSRYGLVDTVDWNMKLAWLARALEPRSVERYLRRVIALDPTQAAAYFNLGKELTRQDREAEAADAFKEAVRLTPSLARFVPVRAARADQYVGTAAHGG